MWIQRDFDPSAHFALPLKVLKGPRQVGKSTLLSHALPHRTIYFDDLATRELAQQDPRFFMDQNPGPLVLDEATLAPNLFLELKRRVDEQRRNGGEELDIWITGSNQTLLQRNVRESLAGRASYFDLATLSIHELGRRYTLAEMMMRGGWPELYATPGLNHARYLNDLIATFIEKDIVSAAGIERRQAFTQVLRLVAGRVGQLFNASDIARNVGVDVTTVQSWVAILEENGILRKLQPHHTNLNQRLIKAPKFYVEDIGLAVRLQGWNEWQPLLTSPAFGSLVENLIVNEISRFFINRGRQPRLSFVRSKEKVEVDLLVELGDQRVLAIEIKSRAQAITSEQLKLLDSLGLNIVEKWIVCLSPAPAIREAAVMTPEQLWGELERVA